MIGDVTPERLRVLRDADEIVLEELVANNLYRKTAQVFAVLLPSRKARRRLEPAAEIGWLP